MASLCLLYISTAPPQRHPLLRGFYELTCEGLSVRAPGNFIARGEIFVPEPEFVDVWLREATAPFGTSAGEGEYRFATEAQFRAFVTSLEPVLCARSQWPWSPPTGPPEELTLIDLGRLVAAFPQDALLRIEFAHHSMRSGRAWKEALDLALSLRSDAEALCAASYVHLEAKDELTAMALLRRAVTADPGHQQAAAHYLLRLEYTGEWASFLEVDEARAAVRARGPIEWELRARVLEKAGRFAEAVDAIAEGLLLRDNAMQRVTRGKLLARLGRDDEALRELTALQSCADLDGHLARADALLRLGRRGEAEQELRWLAHAPSHREAAEARLKLVT